MSDIITPAPAPTAEIAVPIGRGRWRLTLHQRRWGPDTTPYITEITELFDARSRRLQVQLNTPSVLTFTVSGYSASAVALHELTTEVCAWRWNGRLGRDELLFVGPITAAQDVISENGTHSVSITAQDYSALLKRRYLTTPANYSQVEQDAIIVDLVINRSVNASTASGVSFGQGSYLPIVPLAVDPSGAVRGPSGQSRDRNWDRGTEVFKVFEDLGQVINGYDWAVIPTRMNPAQDALAIYFPYRGVDRSDQPLVFGWNVERIESRYVTSAEFANYQILIGKAETIDGEEQPPPFSESWTQEASEIGPGKPGLWMNGSSNSDVSLQSTLDEKVAALLQNSSLVVPAYSIKLTPLAFEELREADINIGDTLPLIIRSGRLDINTRERLISVEIDITDEGTEDVNVGLGRADVTLADLFTGTFRRLSTLENR